MLANHHENKVAEEQAQEDQQQYDEQPAAEPAGRSMEEKTADIEKLAELRDSGALTEEEFDQQKQQVLDS